MRCLITTTGPCRCFEAHLYISECKEDQIGHAMFCVLDLHAAHIGRLLGWHPTIVVQHAQHVAMAAVCIHDKLASPLCMANTHSACIKSQIMQMHMLRCLMHHDCWKLCQSRTA